MLAAALHQLETGHPDESKQRWFPCSEKKVDLMWLEQNNAAVFGSSIPEERVVVASPINLTGRR